MAETHELRAAEDSQDCVSSGSGVTWPRLLAVAFWLLAGNGLVFPIFFYVVDSWPTDDAAIVCGAGLVGFVISECCLIAVVAALAGRSWLTGYFTGLGVALVVFACLWLGALSNEDVRDPETAWYTFGLACWIPWLLLLSASPLMLLRQVFHWRIDLPRQRDQAVREFRLEDLFYVVTLAAAALMFLRIIKVVGFENDAENFWSGVLVLSVCFFLSGLFGLPICVRAMFARNRTSAFFGLMIAPAALFAVLGIPAIVWAPEEMPEMMYFIVTFVASVFVGFYGGLMLARLVGFELLRGRETDDSEVPATSRLGSRLTMGGVILTTMVISGSLGALESWRRQRDAQIDRLKSVASTLNGHLAEQDREFTSLNLGEGTIGADLARFAECAEIGWLNVLSPSFGNDGLQHVMLFPELQAIHLQGTGVTDTGLRSLGEHPGLLHIELADTKVSGEGFGDYQHAHTVQELGLSGTPTNDAGLNALVRFKQLNTLNLSGTRVTDAGLAHLLKLGQLEDISLDDTGVTNAGVAILARHPTLQWISLSGTKIGDESLKHLANGNGPYTLILKDTAITDVGVEWLAETELGSLDLASTTVTGTGFQNWGVQGIPYLDLSDTLVDDQTIKSLASVPQINYLLLDNTEITDAALPHLAKINLDRLSLRGTRLTAKGIKTLKIRYLTVDEGQFTKADITLLEQTLYVTEEVPEDNDE